MLAQRAVVVEHVQPAAERAEHQIALTLLDGNVPHLDRRHSALQLEPGRAAIQLVTNRPNSVPANSRFAVDVILHDRPHVVTLGQVAADVLPRAAAIRTLARRRACSRRAASCSGRRTPCSRRAVTQTRPTHMSTSARPGKSSTFRQLPAAVLGHLQQPIVGPRIDQAFEQRRLVERDDVAERGGRLVVRHRVRGPHPAHHRQFLPFELPRQVRADPRPGVAAIIGAIHEVARPVQPRAVNAG